MLVNLTPRGASTHHTLPQKQGSDALTGVAGLSDTTEETIPSLSSPSLQKAWGTPNHCMWWVTTLMRLFRISAQARMESGGLLSLCLRMAWPSKTKIWKPVVGKTHRQGSSLGVLCA